jgi:hypothetical protein
VKRLKNRVPLIESITQFCYVAVSDETGNKTQTKASAHHTQLEMSSSLQPCDNDEASAVLRLQTALIASDCTEEDSIDETSDDEALE